MSDEESATARLDESAVTRFDSRAIDFTLRVLLPGGVIFFLLARFEPTILNAPPSSIAIVGAFVFLMLGFFSHSSYRALYSVMSRFAPQFKKAREIVDEETGMSGKRKSWVIVRALYIEWRQENSHDSTLKYAARMAPYVHAGYQVALIFAFFFGARLLGYFGGPDQGTLVALASFTIIFGVASFLEDRELNSIEKDFMERMGEGSLKSFRLHVKETLHTEAGKEF